MVSSNRTPAGSKELNEALVVDDGSAVVCAVGSQRTRGSC